MLQLRQPCRPAIHTCIRLAFCKFVYTYRLIRYPYICSSSTFFHVSFCSSLFKLLCGSFIYTSILSSIHQFINSPIHLSTRPSINQSILPSFYQTNDPSVYQTSVNPSSIIPFISATNIEFHIISYPLPPPSSTTR